MLSVFMVMAFRGFCGGGLSDLNGIPPVPMTVFATTRRVNLNRVIEVPIMTILIEIAALFRL